MLDPAEAVADLGPRFESILGTFVKDQRSPARRRASWSIPVDQ